MSEKIKGWAEQNVIKRETFLTEFNNAKGIQHEIAFYMIKKLTGEDNWPNCNYYDQYIEIQADELYRDLVKIFNGTFI